MSDYEVIVIGGGPGGYTSAIRASQLGMSVALVEREHLGGICSNWGCIPTKALLRSAEIFRNVRNSESFGIKLEGTVVPDIDAIVKRSRNVAERMAGGVEMLMRKNKVDVIWGEARLVGRGTLEVKDMAQPAVSPQAARPKRVKSAGVYRANHIVLATGARPRELQGITPDGDRIWTYFEALKPTSIPESLLIVGAGAIGMEFASFYADIGTSVTVLEQAGRILPSEDQDISAFVQTALEKRGITFHTGTTIGSVKTSKSEVTVTLENGESLAAEHLISAAGVVANIENLGLEERGVSLENGLVAVDAFGRTSVPGIWAIGDVTGAPMLAHKAEHQATICVETIAGQLPHRSDGNQVPGCTYCDPQVASVGMTEAQAKTAGHDIRVGKFPFFANGKAMALGEAEGLAKVIFDGQSGEILGAHLAGPEVTELIQGVVTAMQLEATEAEIFDIIYPHPTISEVIKEAALSAFNRSVNI